jgi:DNA (cytosine-5)-methyltransferase 1
MRIGSLFSGYGGLDMAAQAVYGGEVAWVCDNDKAATKVLAHHHPDAPNLGDITAVDWSGVEPVDIITAGFPCQPVSGAGKQLGDADERWLWDEVVRAVRVLRPELLCLENVRGLLAFRRGALFGRVLGTLADIGYDAEWFGLHAGFTDDSKPHVGAPHGRFRVFITAHRKGNGRHEWRAEPIRVQRGSHVALGSLETVTLLPTATIQDASNQAGPSQFERNTLPLNAVVTLLPTPAVNDMGAGKTVEQWDRWTGDMKAKHGNGNGHGPSLHIEALRMLPTPTAKDVAQSGGSTPSDVTLTDAVVRTDMGRTQNLRHALLPTPSVADSQGGHLTRSGDRSDELLLKGVAHHNRFAGFAPAIARWEHVTGHPAPDPTEPAPRGGRRLSCRFDEWFMGLPPGHITNVPGITHNDALKLCGNGVVPQQAEAALRWLHDARETA